MQNPRATLVSDTRSKMRNCRRMWPPRTCGKQISGAAFFAHPLQNTYKSGLQGRIPGATIVSDTHSQMRNSQHICLSGTNGVQNPLSLVWKTSEQELFLATLTRIWTLGVGSGRSLWADRRSGTENPAQSMSSFLKFMSWLSGLLGDAEGLLDESVHMSQPIVWRTLEPRGKVVARGVATALRAFVGGKALSCN